MCVAAFAGVTESRYVSGDAIKAATVILLPVCVLISPAVAKNRLTSAFVAACL